MADTIKIADGSHIQFKHGTQSKLDEIRSAKTGTSGTFYLTNDTHRLYVGLSDNSIVPVNEGITTYATTSELPGANAMNAGQFAYITAESILAVSNGTHWIQINANTDTLYTYSGLTSSDTTTGKVTITTKLAVKGTESNFTQYAFSLTGANGIKIMETTDDGGITVYGTKLTYTVVDNTARIQLVDKDNVQDSAVAIKAGTNVSITENSGAIQISATDTKLDGSLSHGSAESTGFKIFAKDTSGASSGGTIDPVIKYGASGSQSVHFNSGTATLDVYTKDEVDNLKASFDAMEYKGVTSGLPTGDIQNGWTYKVSSQFTIPAANSSTGAAIIAQAGDLIIAETAEGADTILWGYVPSGNEDTTYKIALLTQGIQLQQYPTGASVGTPIGSIEVLSGTNITVSPSSSATDKTMKLTVNHNAANRSDAARTSESINTSQAGIDYQVKNGTITVIDASQGTNGIDTDDQGHIKKVYTKAVTIYDTNSRLTAMGVGVTGNDNNDTVTVALSPSITTSKNETITKTGNVYFKSLNSNLQMTASGSNVQMDFVWGTF